MQAIYYFNAISNNGSFDEGTGYETSKIVDGNNATYGRDNNDGHYCTCTGNTCSGEKIGPIVKVEIGFLWSNNNTLTNIKGRITPYFGGSSAGDNHDATVDPSSESNFIWEDFDITNDTNAPAEWIWDDIVALDVRLTTVRGSTGRWNPANVRIKVTYNIPSFCFVI